MSDYWEKRKKELGLTTSSSYWESRKEELGLTTSTENKSIITTRADKDDDLAPIKEDIEKEEESLLKEKEEERTWFQKGAFEDGFSLKNLGKAILGSAEDVIENVGTGIVGMGEKLVDTFAHLAPYYSQSQFYQNGGSFLSEDMQEKQNQAFEEGKKTASEFIQKDLYDEEKVVKQIYTNNTISKQLLKANPDDLSVFGEKSDALAQSAGQLAATALMSPVVPWWLTTGVTSYGGEVESALKQGATMEEAGVSGLITAGAEILTERISGAIKFGGKTLDEGLTKAIARSISDKTARTLVKLGVDAAGEGFEEVLSGAISAVGQKLTYADDKELSELFSKEEAFESFIGGAVLGGGSSVIGAVKAAKNGVDSVTELTKNEQKVVDKEYKERIAEAEKKGKVSQSEKAKIYDQVLEEMEKGYISTDRIEEILGGEDYNSYKSTAAYEENILKEFEELGKKQNPTLSETHRYNELADQVKEIKEKKLRDQLKGKLSEGVKSLVAGDRLAESYNEAERKRQAFQADLSQYEEKQKATIQKAIDSGILNNTNRTHEFVDLVAKLSADKGVLFDFTNNAKLKESGFALNGASINGYKTADGIVVNVDSAKSRSFVVGHEITHVLEGTDLYGELQNAVLNYAKTKGEYDSRLKAITELYQKHDPEADPVKELTADLVGDYVFSDPDFVNKLSVEHRNVFQKVYDEIKYLLKVATAGSKEARELERVKRIFEQAYRAETKNTADNGVKYDIAALDNGNVYVTASRKVITGKTKTEQRTEITKFFSDLLEGKPSLDIQTIEGDVLTITKKETASKARDDHKSVNGQQIPMSDAEFTVKMHIESHIDEVAEVSKPMNSAQDNKNHPFAKDGFTYRRAYFEDFDGQYYEVTLSIGNNGTIATVYNVGKIKGSVPPSAKLIAVVGSKPLGGTLSKAGIPQNGNAVKGQFSLSDSVGRQISQEQAEYFKDSKVRDENGNLKVMYHGTPNGDITVFKDGTYFTDNKAYADRYQNPGASSISTGKTASNPKTFEVYLDIKKPFDLSDPEAKRIYIEDYIKGGNAMGINPYLSDAEYAKIDTIDWTEGEDLRDFLTENGYHYDGLVLDEGADGGYGDEVKSRGTSFVVFSPEQVKNVDNAQPTSAPDIRFSLSDHETDKNYFDAVSRGDTETAQKMVDEVAKNAGYTIRAYHGTNADFFTFDKGRVGKGTDQYGAGFYFASAKEGAGYYGSRVIDAALKLENPYTISSVNLLDAEITLTDEEAYEVVKRHPKIYDPEESPLGDYYDSYWENGAEEWMIEDLAMQYTDLGYLDSDLFRDYPNELHEAVRDVTGHDGLEVNLSNGDKFYIAWFDNQMKATDTVTYDENGNIIPLSERFNADNNDIRYHISGKDAQQKSVSDPLTDLRLEAQEEIAPVAEDATTEATVSNTESVADLFPDDTAPIQQEYESLLAERDDIIGAMDAFGAVGDYASAEQLMPEYEAVQNRIAEIEADDADRLASLDEADVPPEMENTDPEDVADNVPLTKTLVAELAKNVRSQLGLPANRVAEVRDLIQRYSNEEFPSKAHLYTEIAERFGTISETEVDEDLKNVKARLRTYGINVDDFIKAEIPDYAQLMRSNFGKVRFSKEGLPVDVAYKEFAEALPGYFPESVYAPTDQLMRIIEVANMDTTTQAEYEIDWQTLEDVTDAIMNGVAAFKQNRKETLANKHGRESFESLMDNADQYAPPIPHNTAPVRPAIESVQADPDDIAPVFDTSSGQQALMPEVEVPKRVTRGELHENIVDNIKATFRENGFDLDEVLDNARTFLVSTVGNTPQRVMEKTFGYKEGQILGDLTVNKVAQNETDGIRWLNSFTNKKSGLLAKISKQYGIKPGSKESAAAQKYAEGFAANKAGEILPYGDKELAADFPDTKVRDNIKKLARDPRIRQIYDETLEAINKSRTRNAYSEIPRRNNYFLHFRAMEDTFSQLGVPFNPNDIRAKNLPTDVNGQTMDLKPGQPWFGSAMERKGVRTTYDLLGGLEKYLTSAKNQIYHIDDIQTLRALHKYIAYRFGQAHGLENIDTLSDDEIAERIDKVFKGHLSDFAAFLTEEANIIAGKTPMIDRGIEGVFKRQGLSFLNTLNKQVGANMVGFNVSSSLTNFLAPVQAFAKTNKTDFVRAMAQTSYNKIASVFGKGDNFAEESPVMIRRKGAEQFHRTPYQKIADTGYVLMGMVDDISTELIARTKYNELTRKGMDSNKAHYETDKWVSRLMGDRSLGQQPLMFNSKFLGIFLKFQLEVRNQLDSQFYDTIQEAKVSTEQIENKLLRNAKKAAKITSTFAQLAVVQHLFGKAFESVAGYNPAFDIIEALIKATGWDDEEDDEDTVLDNIEQGFFELMGDMPYISTMTGGRIPMSSALPIEEFYKGEDQYGNEKSRWKTLAEAAPYWVLPGGYGQIKKTKAGLEMFDEDLPIAGSYTDSGNLRFPVEDTTGNRVQAALFGQWASENARDYFNNERKPLQEKQIQELIDTEMPIADYWEYREGLAKYEKLEDKADYIAGLDLPISTKNILVNNVATRKEDIDLTDYEDYSGLEEMDFAMKNPEKYEIAQAVGGYQAYMTYKEGMKDMKLAEKVDYVAGLNLTTHQKNILINGETDRKEPIDLTGYEKFSNFEEFEYAKKNPESYAMAKAVGGYEAYMEYSDALDDIRSDKDKYGKSISGSRKTKVQAYIESLDADPMTKIMLYKSQYTSFDDYNREIVEYVNGRSDMTFQEKIDVLRKLDFDVDAQGNVYW